MVSISKSRVKQRNPYSRKERAQEKILLSVLAGLVGIFAVLKIINYQSEEGGGSVRSRIKQAIIDHRPHLKLESKSSPMLSQSYNAIAQDILDTLECEKLLNKTLGNYNGGMMDDYVPRDYSEGLDETSNVRLRRKLQEGGNADDGDDSLKENKSNKEPGEEPQFDDGVPGGQYDDLTGWNGYDEMTAKELFCLAASTSTLPADKIKQYQDRIQCDATGTKQEFLLDLWTSARAKMQNEPLMLKTLGLAVETTRSLGKHTLNLWAPRNDDGMNYIISQVGNEEESARLNGNNFYGLSHNLGPDHLYVDVGSCLGITTLAVILQYPKTKVVAIEPASPNWLMQEINFKCNLEDDQQPKVLLAGIGPHTKESTAAKLLWRPSAVTSTRAWTPKEEKIDTEDEELFVELKPWKTILAEADIHSSRHIDVLHVDCEGCEYNLIPSLKDTDYESIDTVMGEMHWGYIPLHKLPSSKRGQITHNRLCQHENFARSAKECCGNLQLQVRSAVPGEVLVQDGKDNTNPATVEDVIQDGLCADFDTWKEEHHFYDIENDYGWFEMTSTAA